jgi:preprotein translocase subunit SecA
MTPVQPADLQGQRVEEVGEQAQAFALAAYRRREAEFSPEVTRELERHLYLYTVDEHWREHLHELDHLKGGIGLRAYGQRDPLIEYKREAFGLFETMMDEVREEFVQRFFRVQLQPQAAQQVIETAPRAPRQIVAQHAEAEAFGGSAPVATAEAPRQSQQAPSGAQAQAQGQGQTHAVRTGPRVGRNDPCPCGSGKKYKKCHMLTDEGVESGT